MTQEGPNLSIARSDEDIAACMALRWDVFVLEQSVPHADELDGLDGDCVQVLARVDGLPVGAARFKTSDQIVKIQRVCVLGAMRGAGIGAAIIRFICARSDARVARLSAQTDALAFYRRLDFSAVGAIYMDAGIPHQDMEKALQ